MELSKVEAALESGGLWILMPRGNYWRVRRNGKTQTWSTRPDEYRIPLKMGLRNHAEITHNSEVVYLGRAQVMATTLVRPKFVISAVNPLPRAPAGQPEKAKSEEKIILPGMEHLRGLMVQAGGDRNYFENLVMYDTDCDADAQGLVYHLANAMFEFFTSKGE